MFRFHPAGVHKLPTNWKHKKGRRMCQINESDPNTQNFLQGIRHLNSSDFEYEEANEAFSKVTGGDFLLLSVIFRAYINICAWHIDDNYLELLSSYKDDPVALYMMALYYNDVGKFKEAEFFNEQSIHLMAFPANLILKARTYGFHERKNLMIDIKRLVKNRRAEYSKCYKNIYISTISLYKEGVLQSYMTSVNWESFEEQMASEQNVHPFSKIFEQFP